MNLFKKNFWLVFPLTLAVFTFSACPGDDGSMEPPKEITTYDDEGFFILNSGIEGTGNGSISFYHRACELVANNIFQEANNGEIVGNGLLHMNIIDGKAYIVARNSNKIVIANPVDMKKEGEITGFQQPNYIISVGNGKAYVSQSGAGGDTGSIQIVDLSTKTITDNIPTRGGPEEMIKIGTNVYVANSGGNIPDSIITKISTNSNEILKTIEVGLTPTYLEVDKDLNLWVLTRGLINNPNNPTENIKGKLVKVEDDEVVLSLNVKPAANSLTINRTRDNVYFVQNGWVYEHGIYDSSIALIPFIERYYFGLEVDKKTGDFIGLDAKDLVRNGELIVIDADRTPIDTVEVGITPGRAYFY